MNNQPCCSPGHTADSNSPPPTASETFPPAPHTGSTDGMAAIPGGSFLMGDDSAETWAADGEGPVREITLSPYYIGQTTVTNDQFAAFVEATNYQTEAERFGWSFAFFNQIPKSHRKRHRFDTVPGLDWWARVENATWRQPGGAGTNIRKMGDHPVVQVSWNDAMAYCQWIGHRLPTEAEWECAARGGESRQLYPWGDELTPNGKHRCNIWQGEFPHRDTGADGHTSTAPARAFPRNGFGLYQTSGNVWEWAADWFSPDFHKKPDAISMNPIGASSGTSRVIRGGSFLCHASYCNRYRNSARSGNTPESATCHTGFRTALDHPALEN